MPKYGVVHVPNAAFERIAQVVRSLPLGTEFRPADIRRRVPDICKDTVKGFMVKKARAGWLERIGRGRYRIGGITIKTKLPMALAAEAAWQVFFTDPERRFRSMPQIVGEAETAVGRRDVALYGPVMTILWAWHRDGHLERIGRRGEYRYRLKEGIAERPVVRVRVA